jgi:hypothetical protein
MEGTGGRVAQATWRVTGGGMAGKGHVQKKKGAKHATMN